MKNKVFLLFAVGAIIFNNSELLTDPVSDNYNVKFFDYLNHHKEIVEKERLDKLKYDVIINYYKDKSNKYNPDFHNYEMLSFIDGIMGFYGLDQFMTLEHYIALIDVESSFIPDAKSHKGAKGYAQLMRLTAKIYTDKAEFSHLDRDDPKGNLIISVNFLKDLFVKFDGDMEKTLRFYNGGTKYKEKKKTYYYYKRIKNRGDRIFQYANEITSL